jgi:hypothetical protein
MTAEYNEGYFVEGRRFASRREIFQERGELALRPGFFTQLPSRVSVPMTMKRALEAFLRKAHASGGKLHILYSGGIDSEILLSIAMEQGIPFIPVIVDLFGMNSYELHFARKFLDRNGIRDALYVEVGEREFHERGLPELIFDTETLSHILAGVYLGARACPPGAAIVFSGENPNVVYFRGGEFFFARHEWSLWSRKISRRHGLRMFEAYCDPDVLASYFAYPAVRDRLSTPVPFREWTADHEYLGKEYLYNDPDFAGLERRYAQHGWEALGDGVSYEKGMRAFRNPAARPAHVERFLNSEFVLPLLLEFQKTGVLDYDLAKRALSDGRLLEGYPPFGEKGLKASDFNRVYFAYLGPIGSHGPEIAHGRDVTALTEDGGAVEIVDEN